MNIDAELTEQPIDPVYWINKAGSDAHGANLIFSGSVRALNHGKTVTAVHYDAFAPLCLKVFEELCQEAIQSIEPRARIALIHRLGELKVGELSVLIVVSTPHRDEAYRISRQVIENLKTRAPIWKKEIYETGETEWLQGHSLCSHS